MMVGSYWYLATRGDWDYPSIYEQMYARFERQLCESHGVDMEHVEEMERYVERIETQMDFFTGESDQQNQQGE